jgi:anti-sigma factor RsiW
MTARVKPGLSIDCQGVVELVTEYLEGSLPPDLTSEVEAHLDLCPGCQTFLDQMRRTIEELGRVPVESLSEPARAELLSAFRTFRPGGGT